MITILLLALKTMYYMYTAGTGTVRVYCERKDMAVGVECRDQISGLMDRVHVSTGPDWGQCKSPHKVKVAVICLGTHEPRSSQ